MRDVLEACTLLIQESEELSLVPIAESLAGLLDPFSRAAYTIRPKSAPSQSRNENNVLREPCSRRLAWTIRDAY